jgi:hypothetical protein
MNGRIPTVFISYAWEKDIKKWVAELATRLRNDGIDARIDQWDTVLGDHLTQYMETAIRENDFVVIICTPTYKLKADARTGGVGYEGQIITAEVFERSNHRKFIPILRKGDWARSAPSFLASKLYCDMRFKPWNKPYNQLLRTLHGAATVPPPVGSTPPSVALAKEIVSGHATRESASPRKSLEEIIDETTYLNVIKVNLPPELRNYKNAQGATVFVDTDGLQRVKVYEYQNHCRIRIRCSRDWGFRNCKHRRTARNVEGWLPAIRVDDDTSLFAALSLYNLEWGNVRI